MRLQSMLATTVGFLIALPLLAGAAVDVPGDPAAVVPLRVGDRAPDFVVRRADGATFLFEPARLDRPQMLIFYRGGWCPYCNAQLNDLRHVEPRLRAHGFRILFLSTDRPELLYSSLKEPDIRYTLLSDSQLQAARAFRVAYRLDEATIARQRQYGVDLEATTGTTLHELPVPSVFVVDARGTIRFVYSNPDYKVRLSADALWEAAAPFAPTK